MEFTAAQIAAQLNGVVEGNSDAKVSSLSKIEEGTAGTLSFLANPKYTHYSFYRNCKQRFCSGASRFGYPNSRRRCLQKFWCFAGTVQSGKAKKSRN
jgi:UDP-3-O-[3-hydroxymyristoyl] glucosamine N-acyltransferase